MKKIIWQLIRNTRTEFIFLKLASLHDFFRMFIPRHSYYTNNKIIITRDTINYQLDLSDYTQWKIYSYKRDPGPTLAFRTLKDSSAVVLDIGSNVGEFSFKLIAQFLKHSTEKLTIYSFEPNPMAYSSFLTNASLNHFPDRIKIHPFNIGLGNKRAKLKLNIRNSHSGGASLLDVNDGNADVDIWPLDEFMKIHPTDKVDFIKIDVECFEPFVLEGSSGIIKKFRPFLYIEHNVQCNNKHKKGEDFVYNFLAFNGYNIKAEVEGEFIDIPDFTTLKAMGKVDILATPSMHATPRQELN